MCTSSLDHTSDARRHQIAQCPGAHSVGTVRCHIVTQWLISFSERAGPPYRYALAYEDGVNDSPRQPESPQATAGAQEAPRPATMSAGERLEWSQHYEPQVLSSACATRLHAPCHKHRLLAQSLDTFRLQSSQLTRRGQAQGFATTAYVRSDERFITSFAVGFDVCREITRRLQQCREASAPPSTQQRSLGCRKAAGANCSRAAAACRLNLQMWRPDRSAGRQPADDTPPGASLLC